MTFYRESVEAAGTVDENPRFFAGRKKETGGNSPDFALFFITISTRGNTFKKKVKAFGKAAEYARDNVLAGQKVFVIGRPAVEKFTQKDKDGQEYETFTTSINANSIHILDGEPVTTAQADPPQVAPHTDAESPDPDEVPDEAEAIPLHSSPDDMGPLAPRPDEYQGDAIEAEFHVVNE